MALSLLLDKCSQEPLNVFLMVFSENFHTLEEIFYEFLILGNYNLSMFVF